MVISFISNNLKLFQILTMIYSVAIFCTVLKGMHVVCVCVCVCVCIRYHWHIGDYKSSCNLTCKTSHFSFFFSIYRI